MLYHSADSFEQIEIPDSQVEMWRSTGNPKLDYYIPVPPKPSEYAVWGSGSWIIPEPVVPASVTARQIRLWLVQNGHSLSQVEQAIESIEDSVQREIIRIEWEYAPYVERGHPMVVSIASALGIAPGQIDNAFVEASLL
jgi:hypothetical protein